MIKKRMMLGAIVLAAAVLACQGVAPAPASSPAGSASVAVQSTAMPSPTVPPPLAAVNAVFASSLIGSDSFLRSFPRAGQISCDIPEGGPAPIVGPRVIPGRCETTVAASGSGFIVSLTERWDAVRFHAAADPAFGELSASWTFDVDANGAVAVRGLAGHFPPQLVK